MFVSVCAPAEVIAPSMFPGDYCHKKWWQIQKFMAVAGTGSEGKSCNGGTYSSPPVKSIWSLFPFAHLNWNTSLFKEILFWPRWRTFLKMLHPRVAATPLLYITAVWFHFYKYRRNLVSQESLNGLYLSSVTRWRCVCIASIWFTSSREDLQERDARGATDYKSLFHWELLWHSCFENRFLWGLGVPILMYSFLLSWIWTTLNAHFCSAIFSMFLQHKSGVAF